jgi:hypothetical protein
MIAMQQHNDTAMEEQHTGSQDAASGTTDAADVGCCSCKISAPLNVPSERGRSGFPSGPGAFFIITTPSRAARRFNAVASAVLRLVAPILPYGELSGGSNMPRISRARISLRNACSTAWVVVKFAATAAGSVAIAAFPAGYKPHKEAVIFVSISLSSVRVQMK